MSCRFPLIICQDSLPQGEEPVQDNDASVGSIASIASAQPKLMNVKVRLDSIQGRLSSAKTRLGGGSRDGI
jgi:hypothetical protein